MASTWNLKRLDSLVAEIRALFQKQLPLTPDAKLATKALDMPPARDSAAERTQPSQEAPAGPIHSHPRHGQGLVDAMQRFPVHSMSAVNRVLFERHGYRRMPRHGDPR